MIRISGSLPPMRTCKTRNAVGALLVLRIKVKERDKSKGIDKGLDVKNTGYRPASLLVRNTAA